MTIPHMCNLLHNTSSVEISRMHVGMPRVCTVVLFIIIVTVVVPCVCVCVFVVFCVHLDPKYRYVSVHRDTKNSFIHYNCDFAENASFRGYSRRHLLAWNATNYYS